MNKGFTPTPEQEFFKNSKTSSHLLLPKVGVKARLVSGFTLVEIIIVIGIVSGIILMISLFGFNVLNFSIFLGQDITSHQEIQLTLRTAVSEMRAMSSSVSGAYSIESASQNSIIFYSDLDGDGLTERLRYFLDGTTFKRGVIKPAGNPLSYSSVNEQIREVVHSVYLPAGNIFSYYDENYNGTQPALPFPVSIPSVHLIKMNITADQDPSTSTSRINFYNQVMLRNLQ